MSTMFLVIGTLVLSKVYGLEMHTLKVCIYKATWLSTGVTAVPQSAEHCNWRSQLQV